MAKILLECSNKWFASETCGKWIFKLSVNLCNLSYEIDLWNYECILFLSKKAMLLNYKVFFFNFSVIVFILYVFYNSIDCC